MQGTSSSRTAGKQQDRDPFPAVTFIGRRLAALVITGVSLLIFTMPSVAQAATVFTNFGPSFSYDINTGSPVGNAFTPTASGSLRSLRFALSCASTWPDTVRVSLNTDAGNQPGAILESFSVAGGRWARSRCTTLSFS